MRMSRGGFVFVVVALLLCAIWVDEQTLCIVGFPLSGTDENDASQGDDATNEVWNLGYVRVIHFWTFVRHMDSFHQNETTKTWVTDRSAGSVEVDAVVKCKVVEFPHITLSPLPMPVVLHWHLHSTNGGGSGFCIFWPPFEDWLTYNCHPYPISIPGKVRVHLPENFTGNSMNLTFRGRVWANLHSRPMGTFTLHIIVKNDTGNESNGNSNSNSEYNWYREKGVAYYAKPSYNIVATSFTDENDMTTVKLNIGNYLKNMGDNEIIYTYGTDTGDYRVDIDG
ncbi:MAG: hypothetical protein DRN19_03610 [Thermoplasmata archaeon]|nr:MAG: hypothetical protein DRN19_03610 [Thermoplasmata archaeon]